MQSPEDASARSITEYRAINEPLVPFTAAGHLSGFYRLKLRSKPRAILLIVVVVLVLDLLFGVNRGARLTRSGRFNRSLSLPSEFASFRLN
jgi:hypothetical protein